MKKEIKCPANCNECPHTNKCVSAYGNLGCKFREAIIALGKKNQITEYSSAGIERHSDKVEVTGSNPVTPTLD